jgi:hypothetical protein
MIFVNKATAPAGASNGLLTDLESYWKLDEASGTLADSHGARDVTNNGATYGATGIIDDALDFDGSNDYATTGTWTGFASGTKTISFWFKADVIPTTVTPKDRIITIEDNSYQDRPAFTAGLFSSTLDVGFGGNPWNGYVNLISVSTATWYHIVATMNYSTGALSVYVNGSLEGTATNTGLVHSNVIVQFGRFNSPFGQFFNGILDEVGIWSRELSSTDVTNLYNSGSGLAYGDFTS